MKPFVFYLFVGIVAFAACKKTPQAIPQHQLSKQALGKLIFFDTNLSQPAGQSCATCHAPAVAFSDATNAPISPGSVKGKAGNRNAPSITYSKFIPPLQFNSADSTYSGGLFLDGRVQNLRAQAKHPFFNPLEMNLKDVNEFAARIRKSAYFPDFERIYGKHLFPSQLLENAVDAIATYEKSEEVNPFNSKFDAVQNKKARFSVQEARGFTLFNNKAKCAECHPTTPDEKHGKILFTDFTYDNLGVPRNPNNPFYKQSATHNPFGERYLDLGLSFTTQNMNHSGQFRVPTLRNVALTAPYFHNGIFNTLEEVVHFYNARDIGKFPPPEIPRTVNREELGDLKLSQQEEKDLVAFLKTLTDGYKAHHP